MSEEHLTFMENNKVSYLGVPAAGGSVSGSAKESTLPKDGSEGMFAERYRVVAVEAEGLTIRGIRSGEVMTIRNPDPEHPFTAEEYPLGKLIELSDPSRRVAD